MIEMTRHLQAEVLCPVWLSRSEPILVQSSSCWYWRSVNSRVNSKPRLIVWGTRWRTWLRHSTTRRKVAGSIPDGVTGIFH
jgi:hypothetical protein